MNLVSVTKYEDRHNWTIQYKTNGLPVARQPVKTNQLNINNQDSAQ